MVESENTSFFFTYLRPAVIEMSGVAQLIKAEQRANAMVKDIRLQRHQKMEEAKTKARQLAEDERIAMMAEIDAQRAVVSVRAGVPGACCARGRRARARARGREQLCTGDAARNCCGARRVLSRRVLTRFLFLSLARSEHRNWTARRTA